MVLKLSVISSVRQSKHIIGQIVIKKTQNNTQKFNLYIFCIHGNEAQ